MNQFDAAQNVPAAIAITSPFEEAIAYLEQAQKVGKSSRETLYMLAMCYKRLQKNKEARAALRQIKDPDANVFLQLGLLSFAEGQYADAENDFRQAVEKDPQSYGANYNLFLTRLLLGQLGLSSEATNNLANLTADPTEKQFLTLMGALIRCAGEESPGNSPSSREINPERKEDWNVLSQMPPELENRFVQLLKGMGNVERTYPLFRALARARNKSTEVQRIYLEIVLLRAKQLFDRCDWEGANQILAPLTRFMETVGAAPSSIPISVRIAFLNLEGCCACMLQDFDSAIRCFSAGIKLAGHDAWLYQNLAITCELMGRLDQADNYWSRYFDLLNTHTPAPPLPNYLEALAYASLHRLGETYTRLENWGSALNYMQRAYRLRPRDTETLERLFQLYVQIRRPDDAKRMLRRMRELRPNDPQLDLYELDLREIRSLEDMDKIMGDLKRILGKYPGDARVEERAMQFVANFIPLIGRKFDQLADKLTHMADQIRRLPNYQINWPVVHDEMSLIRHELQNLRKIANKCLSVVQSDEHKRVIRELISQIESKIDVCISMGG